MKLKIDSRARELFKENCPFSYEKCESMEEVDYKIQRCVDLGKYVVKDQDLNLIEITYHKKKLIILNCRLVDMYATDEPEYKISEFVKEQHYNTYYKVLV